MDARKARLLATTSAWALIAAIGAGCATNDQQARPGKGMPRSGDQGTSAIPSEASGTAVRSYRKVREVRSVSPAEEQAQRSVAPGTLTPANALPLVQPPPPNSSASAPDLRTAPVPPQQVSPAGPQRVEQPAVGSEPSPEQPESDPAVPLQEAIPAPPNRASITPTIRSGGGIVAGLPKAGASNGRNVSPPADLQQARPVALPGMSSRELSGIQQVSDARKLFERGRIIEARAALESAISFVPSAALHELGRTFDPYYLGLLPSIDVGSEPRRAAAFYHEAITYGSPTAGIDLNRLKASHQSLR